MKQSIRDNPDTAQTLGLYLHIPFCVRKCAYCDFYSVACDDSLMDRYLNALTNEIKSWADAADACAVTTIYVGGGTPSAFGGERLAELLRVIHSCYQVSDDCEITVECNPDTTTLNLLNTLKEAGANRLSFGVQSASDDELQTIGRLHSFAGAEQALAVARSAGFDNVSLDLIYGLPGQNMQSWQQSVNTLLSLSPEHLSCYALKVEEGTPLWRNRDRYDMADDDLQADMYLWMVERLAEAGYAQYEISNFARPGYQSRHNQKYWLGEDYLGFGPAAYSCFQGRRFDNARNLTGYLEGKTILEQDDPVSERDAAQEYIFLRLRTVQGICAEEYAAWHNRDFAPLEARLNEFAGHGWTAKENGRWHFTPEGFLLSNPLIADLLEVQEKSENLP